MPRNFKSTAPFVKPDPRFDSLLASKIVNKLMYDGKKSTAQKVFYDAIDIAAKKLADVEDPVEIFTKAVDNARPQVEVRSKRVGGANYQVPREVKRNRQQTLAIRWLVDNSRKKKGKPMAQCLAEEIVDAYNGTGASVQWKENVHKMAEANKAYAHYAR
ncbi:MAG: 30S ribosomal protein S7 [Planctomycetes bacterium]|nr:30S ribosomal protein S7 [Planctomycetota bacterium]MCB9910359.1 30S ribosomal protein S7 [Planctomycetota bacterium]MCB9912030.1 30S ribosomal protein S7 [Planctomycetota bacterium]HPF13500.1 30S ribosomal protein S7 [Planctomycetota bacterium]HRV82511.1 30S ribosomal protein S7 [Planctomycetota bacterium]